MSHSSYPFPLAVNSSHHSDYHRFLLGAEPGVLAPFPKPRCIGALAAALPDLSGDLTLAKWRKLYHASIPWTAGFGPAHYSLGNVASHRPLPADYARPARKFGAYDFVQIADPSVSALALVAGDERVLSGFLDANDDFCLRAESRVAAHRPGPSGSPITGRSLVGQFAEPNNRWLMPLLHVHNRFLNFTSFIEEPAVLRCVDHGELSKAGRHARSAFPKSQGEILSELGYKIDFSGDAASGLRIQGVSERLLAAMEAPRIAVLRLLERMLGENGGSQIPGFGGETGTAMIAAMADRLESMLVQSLSFYRPPKVALPSAGPWQRAVRANLAQVCPGDLEALDGAVIQARAMRADRPASVRSATAQTFTASPLDQAHRHVPALEAFAAREQQGLDPDFVRNFQREPPDDEPCLWLARQFEETFQTVRTDIRQGGLYRPFRRTLLQIDQCSEGASLEELKRADRILMTEVEHRAKWFAAELIRNVAPPWSRDRPLDAPEHLFETPAAALGLGGRERGGREAGGIGL